MTPRDGAPVQGARILVVDDHPANVKALRVRLEHEGHDVVEALSGQVALERFAEGNLDLVLLDIMMPGMDGYEVCRRMKQAAPADFVPVIMVTARTEPESVVRALDAGADEYVTKPFEPVELMARVRSMLRIRRMYQDNTYLRKEVAGRYPFDRIVGRSRAMERLYGILRKVIASDVTVLLTGESGTGKETVARCIHYDGGRREERFVAVNCGALSEGLLESELFGHRRGAFTGAAEDRAGLFEEAHGGTIFLDEIAETSPAMQVRLLRVLQEGEVTRVGESRPRQVDARVIAATHRDLEEAVRSGQFREDLFYRLGVFPIHLPPLRERREDIPLLAQHFLDEIAGPKHSVRGFMPEAMEALTRYDWPGNVRELHNELERALVLAAGSNAIGFDILSDKVRGSAGRSGARRRGKLQEVLGDVERELVEAALARHAGNRSRTAAELGITRWTLLQKIKEYGLADSDDG